MKGLRPVSRALGFVLLAAAALAADQQILGRKLLVVEKGSGQRLVVVQGKEYPSGVGYTGDLLILGASLDVIANGASSSEQTFTHSPASDVTCECVTPPVCGGTMCAGSCPTGFGCQDIDPGPMLGCGCITF